jgi:hypothetical protein
MSSNKLHNLIEKYNLVNIIKVFVLLLILFLIYRIFIESTPINSPISDLVIKRNIYEGFQQAMLGNGNIYGNILTLNDPSNIPIYLNNTCIFKLSNTYRIDTLLFNFNSSQTVNISFIDGNGNTKYIKSNGVNSSKGSPPVFTLYTSNSPKSGPITQITDENDLIVYTSQIIITLVNDNTFTNNMFDNYCIYGGDRNLPLLSDFNTISNSLTYSDNSFELQQSGKPQDANANSNIYTFNQSNDTMIYALKMDVVISKIITNPKLTESHFNINITYENSIYYSSVFNINTIYHVRNDYLSVDTKNIYIFLTEPIIANKIKFTVSKISTTTVPTELISINISTLKVLDKTPSSNNIADFKKTVNLLNSANSLADNNTCPNINDLVNTQTQTQQICDTLEFQDKVKSEKIRLERNKQYLLKLKNQQEQIDQLNSVIQDLDSKRQARARISDQARVLQYQKQKSDASTIRDLANQRLESQANNQLYMDLKINTQSNIEENL